MDFYISKFVNERRVKNIQNHVKVVYDWHLGTASVIYSIALAISSSEAKP